MLNKIRHHAYRTKVLLGTAGLILGVAVLIIGGAAYLMSKLF